MGTNGNDSTNPYGGSARCWSTKGGGGGAPRSYACAPKRVGPALAVLGGYPSPMVHSPGVSSKGVSRRSISSYRSTPGGAVRNSLQGGSHDRQAPLELPNSDHH
ncbi:UNVERIFIED_CONTAM: hypothetical protein Sradi_5418800 [Sesamum radiatum]|uniref:Uncharacterized protein n=1 Tax=Sesamum radiatum TaxID=300843 RepID=A0AAW2L863_SESRA